MTQRGRWEMRRRFQVQKAGIVSLSGCSIDISLLVEPNAVWLCGATVSVIENAVQLRNATGGDSGHAVA